MTTIEITHDSTVRLGVVDIRLRIEKLVTKAVADSFPNSAVSVDQSDIRKRLAFVLVAYGNESTEAEILGLIHLARHIYKRTSDVLHGRSNMVNLATVLLAEWRVVVTQLEDLSADVDSTKI